MQAAQSAVVSLAGPPPRAPGPKLGEGFSVERLGSGWRLLANCPLGAMRIHVVLIHPGKGVALLEVEPTWHPDALAAFQAKLEEARFAARFPGHLPVIHRRLRPEHLPALEEILAEAFAWQDPLSIEGEESWEDEVEWILTPAPVPERAVQREDAPPFVPSALSAPPARWRFGLAASLAIACVAGGTAAVFLLPRGAPTPVGSAPAPTAGTERTLQASLVPAGNLVATGPSATDAPTAAEGPAEMASQGPPPDWVDDPASPPPLPAAITAPQRVAWLPAPRMVDAAPPPGPPISTAMDFWSGSLPLGPAAPAPMASLREPDMVRVAAFAAAPPAVTGTPTLPALPPVAEALILPSLRSDGPPALRIELAAAEPLPEPEMLPAPPTDPEPVAAAEPPAPVTEAPAGPVPASPAAPEATPPVVAAEPPAPVTEAPAAPVPVSPPAPQATLPVTPPVQPPVAGAPPMDPALRETMFRRGHSLVAIGDISGARLFLERAASGGSAAAAMALAETYDPGHRARLGVIGLPADPDAALTWYRRAHALGAPEAAARIATLEGPR